MQHLRAERAGRDEGEGPGPGLEALVATAPANALAQGGVGDPEAAGVGVGGGVGELGELVGDGGMFPPAEVVVWWGVPVRPVRTSLGCGRSSDRAGRWSGLS